MVLIDKRQLVIKLVSFTLLLVLTSHVKAQNTGVYELEYFNEQLNSVYKKILNKLEPERQMKLRKAQRAWIIFRDLDCAWAFNAVPLSCLLYRTESRLRELQDTYFTDINHHYISIEK